MKSHYCPEEKGEVQYDGQCNWCGEKEMNAYEMADELRAVLFALGKERPFYNHADTLEQQAAKLEESRAANHRLTELITQQREHIEELRQEIYKLKGQ
jgi:predicted DCC family thiol-disulfide oxidoreductase YuxK